MTLEEYGELHPADRAFLHRGLNEQQQREKNEYDRKKQRH